jgi:membrane protease YdiL (CAAX protease family)
MSRSANAFLAPAPHGPIGPAAAVLGLTILAYIGVGVLCAAAWHGAPAPEGSGAQGALRLALSLMPFAAGLGTLWAAAGAMMPEERSRIFSIAGRMRWREVGLGAGWWSLLVIGPALAGAFLSGETPTPLAWLSAWRGQDIALVLSVGLVGFAAQTLAEEALFRGFLLRQSARLGWRPAALIALNASLFAAIHWPGGAELMAFAGLSGAVFAIVTLARGGIEAAWGGHLVQNLAAGVVLFGPLAAPAPSLDWTDWALAVASLAAFTAAMIWRRPPGAPSAGTPEPA